MKNVTVLKKLGVCEIVYKGEEQVLFVVTMPDKTKRIFLPTTNQTINNYANYTNYSNYNFGGLKVFNKKGYKFISFETEPNNEYEVEIYAPNFKDLLRVET